MDKSIPEVAWNNKVKLIVSDVDETIADLFVSASPEMAAELNSLLGEGKSLFLVSGAGFASIKRRVVDLIKPEYRKRVLVSHCSGAEVKGFDDKGNELERPYYSMYDRMLNQEKKDTWREIVKQITDEFGRTFQCGEGWHSNEETVRFGMPSPRVPKETAARCSAYTLPSTTLLSLCNGS